VGKKALENAIKELSSQVSAPPPPIESAGRVGARLGKRSELTIIVPLVPGGAKRLRTFLQLLGGNLSPGASKVGTLHDMRFVFFDNDTRLLFATSFDGDWDTYIDDFIALIPDYLDLMDSAWEAGSSPSRILLCLRFSGSSASATQLMNSSTRLLRAAS
jgi:hypothetical protein